MSTTPTITEAQLKEILGEERWKKLEGQGEDVKDQVRKTVEQMLAERDEAARQKQEEEEEERRKSELSELELVKEELAAARDLIAEMKSDFESLKSEYSTGKQAKISQQKAANEAAIEKLGDREKELIKKYGGDDPFKVAEMIKDFSTESGKTAGSKRQTSFKHNVPDADDKGGKKQNSDPNGNENKIPTLSEASRNFSKQLEASVGRSINAE